MWKPLGNLILVRFFLIASALTPVCGMCAGSTVPVCWKLPSFSRLPAVGCGCAYPGAAKARSSAEAAPKRTALLVSSFASLFLRTLMELSHEKRDTSFNIHVRQQCPQRTASVAGNRKQLFRQCEQ